MERMTRSRRERGIREAPFRKEPADRATGQYPETNPSEGKGKKKQDETKIQGGGVLTLVK